MKLTEKLTSIAAQAKAIRESMTDLDPRNPNEGIGRADRLIQPGGSQDRVRRVAEAARLISEVNSGRRPYWHLQEAMSTSDFPLLMGDLMYRQMVGNFVPYPVTYPGYFKILDVNDFRALNLYAMEGGQGILKELAEYEPYPETKFVEAKRQVSVKKYGRRYGISFEIGINDDLNAFSQRPQSMAVGARRSEEYLATQQMFDVNGPHAGFFTIGNANIIAGNPPLSIAALQAGLATMAAQRDSDGHPIVIDAVHLVITPDDEVTARNILNATELQISADGGGAGTNTWMRVQNWMKNRLTLHVNAYIPYVVTGTHAASNPWLLVASPNDPSGRSAFAFAFMRGRRTPQLFMKDPDQRNLGGGDTSPMEGNFDNDSIDYKLRHIFGAAQGDPKMAVASDGSGS